MSKSEKIKIMIIISLVTFLKTEVIALLGCLTLAIWYVIPVGIAIISIIIMYVLGIIKGYKKGIKDTFDLTLLGLFISIFNLVLEYIFDTLLFYLSEIFTFMERLSDYSSLINRVNINISGLLTIGHLLIILLLLFTKKMEEKS